MNAENASKSYTIGRNPLLITGLVIIVLFASLWAYKASQIHSLKKEYALRDEQFTQHADSLLVAKDKFFLACMAKPYVWALRTEMMKGNISQLNTYNDEMVREKNFVSVMVADNKGKIISSTNTTFHGSAFSSVYNVSLLTKDTTVVIQANDSLLLTTSPIMGLIIGWEH